MPPKSESVVDRLTDASGYTGASRERFNGDGTGKGHAGREDLVGIDGSTNAGQRNAVQQDAAKPKKRLSRQWQGQKFGTQADAPRKITVFGFGNVNGSGQIFVLNRAIKSLAQVLAKCANLPTGPGKKLLCQDLKTSITTLDGFKDGGQYLLVAAKSTKVSGPHVKGIPTKFVYIERKSKLAYDLQEAKAKMAVLQGFTLPKAEMKAAAQVFEKYDVDGSGGMDINELVSACADLGFNTTDDEMERYIQDFDGDNNGVLDIYEWFGVVAAAKTAQGDINPLVRTAKSMACAVM